MKNIFQSAAIVTALSFAALFTTSSQAEPIAGQLALTKPSAATTIAWRGRRGYWRGGRFHRWGGDGAAVGLGIAGAIIGGAIIANEADRAYAEGYYDDGYDADGAERCAAEFRSFNPATGTYTGYDGVVRPCPYL